MIGLNKIEIIGNLTRDPELRYTPAGQAVASFGVATNRAWKTSNGEKKQEVEYHNIIAWGNLAEICNQILAKGRRVYVEGRMHYNNYEDKEGVKKSRPEIISNNVLVLDSKMADKKSGDGPGAPENAAPKSGDEGENVIQVDDEAPKTPQNDDKKADEKDSKDSKDNVDEISIEDVNL